MDNFNKFTKELIKKLREFGYRDISFEYSLNNSETNSGILRYGGDEKVSIKEDLVDNCGIYPLATITKIESNGGFDYHFNFEPFLTRLDCTIDSLEEDRERLEDLADIPLGDLGKDIMDIKERVEEVEVETRGYVSRFHTLKAIIEELKDEYPIIITHGDDYIEPGSLDKINKYLDTLV